MQVEKVSLGAYLKMVNSRPLLLYFCLFNTVDSKQMFYIQVWQCLDSNHGPLVQETTALPTAPQPLAMLRAFPIMACNIPMTQWKTCSKP